MLLEMPIFMWYFESLGLHIKFKHVGLFICSLGYTKLSMLLYNCPRIELHEGLMHTIFKIKHIINKHVDDTAS